MFPCQGELGYFEYSHIFSTEGEVAMLDAFFAGLQNAVSPENLFVIFAGIAGGIIFGAIPGVGPTEGVALLIPFTYTMSPDQALIFLGSVYQGGTYGGQVAALLFRIPGSSEAVCTIFDGYAMAQKGEVGRAFGLGLSSSVFGGLVGVLALIFLSPLLADFALSFSPAEYFALGVLGLSAISGIGDSPSKGLIAALLGLVIATIGLDPISGTMRFSFSQSFMVSGIPMVPALIGLFAASEVFFNVGEEVWKTKGSDDFSVPTRVRLKDILEVVRYRWVVARSAVIGVVVGVLPGVGATTAAILSYNAEQKINRNKEGFGKGQPEGIVAPEVANNAAVGSALVPLLSLGIPGSGTTAVMLAAMLIHGLRPGPLLMIQQKEMAFTVFGGMLVGVVVLLIVAVVLLRVFLKSLTLPYQVLSIVILSFCVIGSLTVAGNVRGIAIMFVFGLIGYFMRLFDYPAAPMLIGIVLGPIMETSFRRALMMNDFNLLAVVSRPITLICLVLAAGIFMSPYIPKLVRCVRKGDFS